MPRPDPSQYDPAPPAGDCAVCRVALVPAPERATPHYLASRCPRCGHVVVALRPGRDRAVVREGG